jgi:hypothetical protein
VWFVEWSVVGANETKQHTNQHGQFTEGAISASNYFIGSVCLRVLLSVLLHAFLVGVGRRCIDFLEQNTDQLCGRLDA